jgi:hypothetical protein
MATINSDGKVAYIYNQSNDTWYALGAAVNTNAEYTWTADQDFNAVVTFDTVVNAKAGINNYQNPTARDSSITAPTNGIVCFVRQENSGTVINQIQYYHNGEWRFINDSVDLLPKTSNYTIEKKDAGKTILVASSSDVTITIPVNSTTDFIVGQKIEILRNGTGNVIIAGATPAVIINSKNSNKKIAAQYSGAVCVKTEANNTWILIGDLTA